jgi:hypothetical protein
LGLPATFGAERQIRLAQESLFVRRELNGTVAQQ